MIKNYSKKINSRAFKLKSLRIVSLCLLAFLINLQVSGEERPKVGLVLSGGGAKGLAHIGILKAIDEAGLKVDYVTGTSMGSIVGAMYAAGYSGAQIEQIAEELDWVRLLSGQPTYNEVRLDEKDQFENSSVSLALNGFKLAPSTGLLESEEIWIKFSEILFPVNDIKDFDSLSIPFKCIATDLTTGDAVVLDKGEIVYAIRASMSIPGVFAAVDYKDTKLVDGGIVRNFPASDVRAMGADYVIGVNVFNGLSQADDLGSAIEVMYQVTNYRDANDLIKQKKLCNLIIEPEVDAYSPASFDAADEIIEVGNNSGEQYLSFFKNLADSLNQIEPVTVNVDNRLPQRSSVTVDSLQIEGLQWTSEAMLLRSLNIKLGEAYTPEQLSEAFKGAYSSLSYQYVYYQVIPTEENHCVLKCMVKEDELHHLNFGLSYQSFMGASIIVNSIWRDLIFDQSRTMLKLNVGENWRAHFKYNQKMGKSHKNIFYLNARAERSGIPVYNDGDLSYLFKGYFYNANFGYSYIFNKSLGMSIGIGHKEVYFKPSVSAAQLNGHLKQNFFEFKTEHNTLNRRFFPQKGSETNFIASLGVNRSYNYETNLANSFIASDSVITPSSGLLKLHLAHRAYFPLNDKFTLFETINLAYAENGTGVIFDDYLLGGVQKLFETQVAFAGLKTGGIHTHSIASLGIGAQYQFYKEFYTILRLNVAAYDYDNPFKKDFLNDARYISGGGLSLAYYLPLLPMEFTVMYSPYHDEVFTNASIGFTF